jgi:hypothetical protein
LNSSDTPCSAKRPQYNLIASAKREAAKRGLYSRFFRGPVLSSGDDERTEPLKCAETRISQMSEVETTLTKRTLMKRRKQKNGDGAETKERRREKKRRKKGSSIRVN